MFITNILLNNVKRFKVIILILLFCISLAGGACASSKRGYKPTRQKKKDCDCSKWSYNVTGSITILVETLNIEKDLLQKISP